MIARMKSELCKCIFNLNSKLDRHVECWAYGCALNKQSVDKQSVYYTPCKKAVVKNTPC